MYKRQGGILFLIALDSRDYVTITSGGGVTAFTDYRIAQIEDKIVPMLSDGSYYKADVYKRQVQGQGVTLYFVKSGSTMQQPLDGDSMTQGTTAGSDTDVGIYVLESASDSEYTLSKEELALVDICLLYTSAQRDLPRSGLVQVRLDHLRGSQAVPDR